MNNREFRELNKSFYNFCQGMTLNEKEEFSEEINKKRLQFIYLNNRLWFRVTDLSSAKGRNEKDYVENWLRKNYQMRGVQVKLEDKELIELVREEYWKIYNRKFRVAGSLLVDAERAYHYLFSEKVNKVLFGKLHKRKLKSIVVNSDEPRIPLAEIIEQLSVLEVDAKHCLITYKKQFEELAPIVFTSENKITTYYLTETQALLLSTLITNTSDVVNFKMWLVQLFYEARESSLADNLKSPVMGEAEYQSLIVELSNYTSIKIRPEAPIHDKRIDLLIQDSIGVELKRDKFTVNMVRDTIGNRGYYTGLKKHYPNFKLLLLSSPKGITEAAMDLIKPMYPYVQFVYTYRIADTLARLALAGYPKVAQWWFKYTILPKYKSILSEEFLKNLNE